LARVDLLDGHGADADEVGGELQVSQ
jgi:hypothetical protein